MRAIITTTITTHVDITTFETEHEVDVECKDELPQQVLAEDFARVREEGVENAV